MFPGDLATLPAVCSLIFFFSPKQLRRVSVLEGAFLVQLRRVSCRQCREYRVGSTLSPTQHSSWWLLFPLCPLNGSDELSGGTPLRGGLGCRSSHLAVVVNTNNFTQQERAQRLFSWGVIALLVFLTPSNPSGEEKLPEAQSRAIIASSVTSQLGQK